MHFLTSTTTTSAERQRERDMELQKGVKLCDDEEGEAELKVMEGVYMSFPAGARPH